MIGTEIHKLVRDVVDFPKKGIVFKDITTLLMNKAISDKIIDEFVARLSHLKIDAIAGIESRGFLFGYPLAMELGVPFILIRKKGKLPYKKRSHSYELEYGSAVIEMHEDAVKKGQKVLIHDDLLATGGSASAAAELIKKCGGSVFGFNFLVALDFLKGDEKLKNHSSNIINLVRY